MKNLFSCFLVFILALAQLKAQQAQIYYKQGQQSFKEQDYKQAIEHLDKALQENPSYFEAFLQRGLSYYALSDYPNALSDFSKAISLNDTASEAYYNRGITYFYMAKDKQATQDFQQSLHLNPISAKTYLALGVLCEKGADYKKAIQYYRKAVKLEPEYAVSYYNLANALWNTHKSRDALEQVNLFLSKKPRVSDGLLLRAEILLELKQPAQALADAKQVIDSEPLRAEAFYIAGKASYALQSTKQACEYWQTALKMGLVEAQDFLQKYCP